MTFTLVEEGPLTKILAKGVGSHAAWPQGGTNAITGLLALLDQLPLAQGGAKDAIHALTQLLPHGDYLGKALGIAQSRRDLGGADPLLYPAGDTPTGLEGRFDSRVPLCAAKENCSDVAEAAFARTASPCPVRCMPLTTRPPNRPLSRPCSSAMRATPA